MRKENTAAVAEAQPENPGGTDLEQVMQRHETALLRYAARLLNDTAAAQDVVQLVFLRYVDNCERVTLKKAVVKAWLYRVTHNLAIDHLRREQRQARLQAEGGAAAIEENLCAQREQETVDDRRQQVLRLLPQLPAPEREVLILRLQQGLSYREIAYVTGRSEGNVGCLLHHAVNKMMRLCRENEVLL